MLRVVLLAALLLGTAPASDQRPAGRSYAGTVGSSRIVLTLEDGSGDDGAFGNYFYLSSRQGLDLQGTRRGDRLTLDALASDDHLELRMEGDRLVGTLTTAAKRRFAVTLAPITAAHDLPAGLPPELSLHERLQLAGLTLVPGATEQIDGRTIRWYIEPRTGVRLFRLQAGYAAAATAAINTALTRNHWREVSTYLGCTEIGGGSGVEGGIAGKPWLGRHQVSYAWQSGWSCAGAAHPDFGIQGYSFDARTGRALRLDDVLPVGTTPAPSENSDAWYTYRSTIFAPAVVTLLRRYHRLQMQPVEPEGDACDYGNAEVWSFPAWRLSAQGLWLGASFPRVMRACDTPDWAVLPWSVLALKPGG